MPLSDGRDAILHPDGKSVLVSGGFGLWRWALRRDETAGRFNLSSGPPEILSRVRGLAHATLHPDGRRIAVGHIDGPARIFNLQRLDLPPLELPHPRAVYVSFSPDGQWLATATWQGRGVKVWKVETGEFIRDIIQDNNSTAKFSPDGRWLVTGTGNEYRFWETGSWLPRHRVPRQSSSRTGAFIVFSPDGSLTALVAGLRGVRLVDSRLGRELAVLDTESQYPLCFSSDGTRLVTGDVTGPTWLWELSLIRRQLAAMQLDWAAGPSSSGQSQ